MTTDAALREALPDFALLIGMEHDLPPTGSLGHKRLEMLVAGKAAAEAALTARAENARLRAALAALLEACSVLEGQQSVHDLMDFEEWRVFGQEQARARLLLAEPTQGSAT